MAIWAVSIPLIMMLLILGIYFVLGKIQARREEQYLEEAKILPQEGEDSVEAQKASKPLEALSEIDAIRADTQASWLKRLRSGLDKTRTRLSDSVGSLFSGKARIDEATLEKLHEALYRADIGVKTADTLVDAVRRKLKDKEQVDWADVSTCLKTTARDILAKPQAPLHIPAKGPWVILICGVNGVGKTTSIGKIAARFLAEDKKVLLAAADTYRAAAIEQLKVWGDRLGIDVISHKQGSDPAAVAYDAVKAAMSRKADVLIIDTAGRLHSKGDLMEELRKINRVIGKDLPGAPHETWLVIDATTGQNAVLQVKAFKEVVDINGLVVTKLDGTAKGGVLVGISDQFDFPIRYVGVGEKAQDLRVFSPSDFADSLF